MDSLTICGPLGGKSRTFPNSESRSDSPMSILFSSQAIGDKGTNLIDGTVFESLLRSAIELKPGEAKTRKVRKKGRGRKTKRK